MGVVGDWGFVGDSEFFLIWLYFFVGFVFLLDWMFWKCFGVEFEWFGLKIFIMMLNFFKDLWGCGFWFEDFFFEDFCDFVWGVGDFFDVE